MRIMGKNIAGGISLLVLILGVSVGVTIGGLVLVAATQYTISVRTDVFERALTIAQSGAEYYRWHLAHAPSDFTDGTGQPGPYVHQISDPYGGTEGAYSLTVTPPASGSTIVKISSTGWLASNPEIKRTVLTTYGKPSIAKYAFLQNANVWYGQKITVHGPIFSNGGIRMDGVHDSTVQSAKQTYICGAETGCTNQNSCNLPCTWSQSTSQCTCPGVWGQGGPQALWDYPVTPVDFNSFAVDFVAMQTAAQNTGVYLGPSGAYGYHITFTSDGNYTITRVTGAINRRGWSVEGGCENLYQDINSETPIGTYSVSQKPVVFAEDHLWVDGVVNGKITVVAARFPLDVNKMNIWINDSVTYVAKDGQSDLGLIAQNDILFALDIPQIFEIDAALLAQKGRVIRHNYRYPGCSNSPLAVRQELIIYGSLISNLKSYWSYGQGSAGFGNDPVSGFSQREVTYDPTLYFGPPPYFPTQGEYEFISWEER